MNPILSFILSLFTCCGCKCCGCCDVYSEDIKRPIINSNLCSDSDKGQEAEAETTVSDSSYDEDFEALRSMLKSKI